MNGTLVRILSAAAALIGLALAGYFGGARAIQVIAAIIIFWGLFEFVNITLPKKSVPFSIRLATLLAAILAYSFTEPDLLYTFVITAGYITVGLWITRNKFSNQQILNWLASGTLGIFYFAVFPGFALALFKLQYGLFWFLFLLVLVFFGDTFAYFGGRFFGKNKLMPNISPNKTIEGAVGGVLGSALASWLFAHFLLNGIPWYYVVSFAIVCGFVAQAGDLFVSLIKRVADVKDSGKIMPGHGGILDRLDGVYIAAPLVYTFALYTSQFVITN